MYELWPCARHHAKDRGARVRKSGQQGRQADLALAVGQGRARPPLCGGPGSKPFRLCRPRRCCPDHACCHWPARARLCARKTRFTAAGSGPGPMGRPNSLTTALTGAQSTFSIRTILIVRTENLVQTNIQGQGGLQTQLDRAQVFSCWFPALLPLLWLHCQPLSVWWPDGCHSPGMAPR